MNQLIRRFPEFNLSVQFKRSNFINPPQNFQRNLLLSQVVGEFARDLDHLDKLAPQFVPGSSLIGISDGNKGAKQELQEIMEDWQIPLMEAMAEVVTEKGGHILEIGFGRGVSAGFIQKHGVASHTLVECAPEIVEQFYVPWKEQYPDQDIRLIEGMWQDVGEQLGTYDGIFFHTYILDQEDLMKYVLESVTFAEHFFPTASAHLGPGGIFTYLSNEVDSLSRAHQRLLLQHFSSFTVKVVQLKMPREVRDFWWAPSMVVVKAVK